MKNLTAGLIGNPNTGKTTLFNQLTGSHQRVGNWAGVTVEYKEGFFRTEQHRVKLVDLPGTYTLATASEHSALDEQIACQFILNQQADVMINVVDASNLERNLYLTLQLLESGVPCIVVLNMLDIATSRRMTIDADKLSHRLGCPVIPVVSNRGQGIDTLKKQLDAEKYNHYPSHSHYPPETEQIISQLAKTMPHLPDRQSHWLAVKILEGDVYALSLAGESAQQALNSLPSTTVQEASVNLATCRYQTINHLLTEVADRGQALPHRLSQKMDAIVLNRWLGIPIFLGVMYLMFFLAINIGGALQPLFDTGSTAIFIHGIQWTGWYAGLPEWLTSLLAQGVGGGINTVMPLIPQLALMYLFLSFIEDSGYMARAAFIIDRLMQSLGLPGKSFVPLIVGFGCNVPSVTGARTLDTPRERLITIMMAPFMSCGARLAIFAVFSAAFFGQKGALVIFSLYLVGIITAILTGLMLKHTLMRGESTPFIMELPLYHVPDIKSLLLQTWLRLKGFVLRAGKVIVIVSIFLGVLNSFSLRGQLVDDLNHSALATLSRAVTPVLKPMGIDQDNWQATVGLITGAMAKEVVVGTLNTLYTAEAIQETPFAPDNFSLVDELWQAVDETRQSLSEAFSLSTLANPLEASKGDGEMASSAMGVMHSKFANPAAAYSYLLFVLLYVPCASVMGAIARETNRRWMLFSILWGLNLAWSLAVLFYQIASFIHHPASSSLIIAGVVLFNTLLLIVLRMVRPPTSTIPVKLLATSSCDHCTQRCHENKQ